MKKHFLILLVALCTLGNGAFAQKNSRENVKINFTHIPYKLIYDQIKTYSYRVYLSGERHGYSQGEVKQLMPKLTSFQEATTGDADMKVTVSLGPLNVVENRLVSENRTREKDGKKESYTVYYILFSAKYNMTFEAVNAKNGMVIYRRATDPETPDITFKSEEFSSHSYASSYWENNSATVIAGNIRGATERFVSGAGNGFKAMFDFYPTTENAVFYSVKKTDIADLFNGNLNKLMSTLKTMTSDESPDIYKKRLSAQIGYFESIQDQFDPKDKKVDVLYSAINFNLASLYYCLDDFERAGFYMERLKAVKDNEAQKRELAERIDNAQKVVEKHLLPNRHLDYNPVLDFRLEGKPFVSDAMSSAEKQVKDLVEGNITADDTVILSTDEMLVGKVVYDDIKHTFSIVLPDDAGNPILLTPAKVSSFSYGEQRYYTVKQSNGSGGLVRHFAVVLFESDKIKLLEKTDGNYNPIKSYMLWSSAQEMPAEIEMGFKKTLSKYLADCDNVSTKVKDGEYGSAFSFDITKFIKLCQDYTDCDS